MTPLDFRVLAVAKKIIIKKKNKVGGQHFTTWERKSLLVSGPYSPAP